MAQVTDSLLAEFQARVDRGEHINSTVNEERQLLHGFREWKRLLSLQRGPQIPEGWKLVPVEPTEEMLRVATHASVHADGRPWPPIFWRTILNAAPPPPEVHRIGPQEAGTYKGHARTCDLFIPGGKPLCTCGHRT